MIASLRRRIERWVARPLAKAAVWLALAVAAWAVLAAYMALWVKVPEAAGYVTVYLVGGACGLLADRPRRLEREIMATQLDEQRAAAVVVERGAGVLAPERQPLAPTVFVDRSLDPERWLNQGQRAITERCGCGAPGNSRRRDGTVECWRCTLGPLNVTRGPQSSEPTPMPGHPDEEAYAAALQRQRMAKLRFGADPVDVDDMPPFPPEDDR